jgi:hypothetical protein
MPQEESKPNVECRSEDLARIEIEWPGSLVDLWRSDHSLTVWRRSFVFFGLCECVTYHVNKTSSAAADWLMKPGLWLGRRRAVT